MISGIQYRASESNVGDFKKLFMRAQVLRASEK